MGLYGHSDQRHFVVCIYIQHAKSLSRVRFFGPHGLYSPWNSPGQNTGVGSLSLLQGIFPTQELNWGLLHCRWILCELSYHLAYRKFENRYEKKNWVFSIKVSIYFSVLVSSAHLATEAGIERTSVPGVSLRSAALTGVLW